MSDGFLGFPARTYLAAARPRSAAFGLSCFLTLAGCAGDDAPLTSGELPGEGSHTGAVLPPVDAGGTGGSTGATSATTAPPPMTSPMGGGGSVSDPMDEPAGLTTGGVTSGGSTAGAASGGGAADAGAGAPGVSTPGDGGPAPSDAGTVAEPDAAGDAVSDPPTNEAGHPTSCGDPLALDDAPFEFSSTENIYDVDADTLQGIRNQMTLRSPAPMAGAVAWQVRWDFDQTACDGSGLVVQVDVEYTMPRWHQPASATQDVIDGWGSYVDALWCHEYGHTDFGVKLAQQTYEALSELPATSNCWTLRQQAQAAFDPIYRRITEEEAEYDRVTNHGATMGARFPTDRN